MKVIVDTSVWSLALCRNSPVDSGIVQELRDLINDHRVQMIGPVRQELLAGIRYEAQFESLAQRLETFPDQSILSDDYVSAARIFNQCRAKGVQGSNTDFLICAIALRNEFAIFTTDKDFDLLAEHVPILLHGVEANQ
jgi:predicted nucleic acid-binding protein